MKNKVICITCDPYLESFLMYINLHVDAFSDLKFWTYFSRSFLSIANGVTSAGDLWRHILYAVFCPVVKRRFSFLDSSSHRRLLLKLDTQRDCTVYRPVLAAKKGGGGLQYICLVGCRLLPQDGHVSVCLVLTIEVYALAEGDEQQDRRRSQ